eukprot:SAG25_NODE_8082_length_441_cov_0.619883_1_plen_28_part_10
MPRRGVSATARRAHHAAGVCNAAHSTHN